MEILERIVVEIREAFRYCKTRNKNKFCGDRFEEWVVENSNISKDGLTNSGNGKSFWRLLDWRGDKYINGYRALSSSAPDLLMECISTDRSYGVGEIIAVECKWKSNFPDKLLEIKEILKYEAYLRDDKARYSVKHLFYVFGFGWSCNPVEVYVVPANALYTYNVNTGSVIFHVKGKGEELLKQLERYKWNKAKSRFLMYWGNK